MPLRVVDDPRHARIKVVSSTTASELSIRPGSAGNLELVVPAGVLQRLLAEHPESEPDAHPRALPPTLPGQDPGEPRTLEAIEREAVVHALHAARGNLTRVAATLGIARSTLYLKLAKYGLDAAQERSVKR